MQVYIHKNEKQLGPFDEAKVMEMIRTGEIGENDLAFRHGDTEWAKVGVLYPKSVSKVEADEPTNTQELTPEEIEMNEAMRQSRADTIDPKVFIRKVMEFKTWHVPILNEADDVIAGERLKIPFFNGLTDTERHLTIFSDDRSYSVYVKDAGEKAIPLNVTLPGHHFFATYLTSGIDYVVLNRGSDNALLWWSEEFELLIAMADAIKIEEQLREFKNGNEKLSLMQELVDYPHYFWVKQLSGETFILEGFGQIFIPIFTSPDCFDQYIAIYCEMKRIDPNDFQFELINGTELYWRVCEAGVSNIVVNMLTSQYIDLGSEYVDRYFLSIL